MTKHAPFMTELEQVMVQQFRTLQQLITLSQVERSNLLKRDADALIKNAEAKEGLLDQIALLEDRFRMVVQKLALALGIFSEITSLPELLPSFSPEDQQWIQRLSAGMHELAHRARALNDGNEAIVIANLEWVRASQLFLWNLTLPDPTYAANGSVARAPASSGMEIRV